jgi:hypothetical protein
LVFDVDAKPKQNKDNRAESDNCPATYYELYTFCRTNLHIAHAACLSIEQLRAIVLKYFIFLRLWHHCIVDAGVSQQTCAQLMAGIGENSKDALNSIRFFVCPALVRAGGGCDRS